jgi:hypothetical protein
MSAAPPHPPFRHPPAYPPDYAESIRGKDTPTPEEGTGTQEQELENETAAAFRIWLCVMFAAFGLFLLMRYT